MVNFCENIVECRRVLLLRYLGEEFNRKDCKGTCDICSMGGEVEKRNVTTSANQILKLLSLMNEKYTLAHVVDVFRGSKKKKIVDLRHDKLPGHGAGKSWLPHGLFFDFIIIY